MKILAGPELNTGPKDSAPPVVSKTLNGQRDIDSFLYLLMMAHHTVVARAACASQPLVAGALNSKNVLQSCHRQIP